jgi:tetratricopeptide (TPR) repeat protein
MSPQRQAGVLAQKALVTAALFGPGGALGELTAAARTFAREKDDAGLALVLNNRARIHENSKKKRVAIECYRSALKHARKANDVGLEHSILFNLATAYRDVGKVVSARATARALRRLEPNDRNRYHRSHFRLLESLGLS